MIGYISQHVILFIFSTWVPFISLYALVKTPSTTLGRHSNRSWHSEELPTVHYRHAAGHEDFIWILLCWVPFLWFLSYPLFYWLWFSLVLLSLEPWVVRLNLRFFFSDVGIYCQTFLFDIDFIYLTSFVILYFHFYLCLKVL